MTPTANPQHKHYDLLLDYGKPTERIVLFATRAERLAFATKVLKEERASGVGDSVTEFVR